MSDIASVIVEYIVNDMRDRHGFRQLWDDLDEEIEDEVYNHWINQINLILKERLFNE